MVTGWRQPAPADAITRRQLPADETGPLSSELTVPRPLPGALAGEDIRKDCGAQVPGYGWLEP